MPNMSIRAGLVVGIVIVMATLVGTAGNLEAAPCWRKVCSKWSASGSCLKHKIERFNLPGYLKCAGKPTL